MEVEEEQKNEGRMKECDERKDHTNREVEKQGKDGSKSRNSNPQKK